MENGNRKQFPLRKREQLARELALLELTDDAAKRKDPANLGAIATILFELFSHAMLYSGYVDFSEYVVSIKYNIEHGTDPTTDPEALTLRERVASDLETLRQSSK